MNLAKFAGVAELVATGIISSGVGAVVGNIIKTTTPADLKIHQKISVAIGAFAISNVLGDLAAKSASEAIKGVFQQAQAVQDVFEVISDEKE